METQSNSCHSERRSNCHSEGPPNCHSERRRGICLTPQHSSAPRFLTFARNDTSAGASHRAPASAQPRSSNPKSKIQNPKFFAFAIAFAFATFLAFAQQPAGVLVACQGAGNCPTGGLASPYTDLQEAIDAAVAQAETLGQQVLLLVAGTPWIGPYTIPADANVHILGLSFNSQQTVTIVNPGAPPTAGSFTLAFTNPSNGATDTTIDLDFDATAAEVEAALEALTTIGVGNVTVTGPDGGPYSVNFVGTFASVAVPLLVADDTNLNPPEAFVLVLSDDGPFSTVIHGGGTGSTAALTIEGETAAKRDAGVGRGRLIIEGLTFTDGGQGIRVNGGALTPKIEPVLNRLFVRDNGNGTGADVAGVLVEGSSDPLLVNCSISSNNGDGVRVDGVATDLTDVDILHCSIVGNANNGVFVAMGNDARVRNTLVFENGTGTGEGGLVWEDNPFIDPDNGPLDGLNTAGPLAGTPIHVTVFGTNLVEGATTRVFFGPSGNPATEALLPYGAQTDAQLSDVLLPPAYNGIPGQVDVTIRRGDGFEIVVPNGFTYTAEQLVGGDPVPAIWQVDPGWGPTDNAATPGVDESAIDVYVIGAFFDRDCSVFFDLNDNDILEVNEQSPRVQWLSSGRLFVRVPTNTLAAKVDVWVRNNPSGQVTPLGPLEEYEYRAGFTVLGPDIRSIIPNSIGTPAGTGTATDPDVLPDIFGNNFAADCVVKFGGVVCAYASVNGTGTAILDIQIPPSPNGGGGPVDVEVVNPDGTSDVLPNGFTYFASSAPLLDAFPWRVSNFIERGSGGTRSIVGTGFDNSVDLIADPVGVNNTYAAGITPVAQREIPFAYPADTDGLGLAAGERLVPIRVHNRPPDGPTIDTELIYAETFTVQNPPVDGAVFFRINSVNIQTVGATDIVEMDIENYRTQFAIFFGDVQVPPGGITNILTPNPPGNYNGVIQFPVPAQPEGVWGPVDVRVESPGTPATTENRTGRLLYTIAENAYSYRRPATAPQGDSVVPNTVPDNGSGPVRITGQNFTGATNAGAGGLNTNGVYTRVWLDDPANAGLEIDLSAQATSYTVDSFSQITFDINLDTIDLAELLITRNTPIDLVFEQYDDVNDTPIAPQSRFIGAIRFANTASPQIVSITPDRGPVGGVDQDPAAQITIDGTDFGATEPIVLFGSSQANVFTYLAETQIVVDLPPAPNGYPGVYDVTVIRTSDLVSDTLIDAFTYEIVGPPVVTAVSPNHIFFDPADPTTSEDPAFITIIGYNFDDDVRVSFYDDFVTETDTLHLDTLLNPTQINVLSPNEITVQLTRANMQTLLQAGDYIGPIADIAITVQNQPTVNPLVDPALAATLTSDPRTQFFAYSDARGDVTVDMPELLFNDVYANSQDDYVNVSPGSGSISIDPVILGTPWIGKLFPDAVAHPLLSTAGPFTEDPYTLTDFELDARPQGDGAEIGADEIADQTIDVCSWFLARVTPNPVGVSAANQLLVEVQFSGNCGGAPFIVPQGGDPREPADRIALTLYQNPGNGFYIYTNTDAITTLLAERDGVTGISADLIAPDDLIADGHAAVYMEKGTSVTGSGIIGFDHNVGLVPSSSHLTDGGVISSQAIAGRHFLIDTVPPRMDIANSYGGVITADELVFGSNDQITALDIDLPSHPQGAPPAALPYRPSLAAPWPIDDGGIYFRGLSGVTTIPDGTQIFFNRGSDANPDSVIGPPFTVFTGATLDTSIRVVFIDPPVTDPVANPQVPIPGLDFYTGLTNRQVAGFPIPSPANLDEAAGEAPADNILNQGTAHWFPDPTLSLTHGFEKHARFVTSVGSGVNDGVFRPALLPGDSVPSPSSAADPGNDQLTVEWDLLGLMPVANQTWRVRAQFVGEDLAFNATTNSASGSSPTMYYSTLFDPLQLWWMYDVASSLAGPSNCEAAPDPFFTVQLRGQRPSNTGEPYPAFTYNLYTSIACAGPYVDSGIGWAPWRLATSIDLLAELTPAQEALLNNQYVMIVSLGADEAGNVEPLLFDPTTVDPSALPPNAKTFYFTNQQPADTAVNLELWYDLNDNGIIDGGEPIFGDNPIVPFHPLLRARYAVSVNPLGSTAGPFNVTWSFHEDGVQSLTDPPIIGPFQSNSDVVAVVSPGDITPIQNVLNPGRLGSSTTAITYLFTAAAFYNDGVNDIVDPSPASAYFVVVPAGVGDYVSSSEDPNKQPIKEQGNE